MVTWVMYFLFWAIYLVLFGNGVMYLGRGQLLTTSRQAKSVLRLSLLVIISTPHYYKYIENLVLGF